MVQVLKGDLLKSDCKYIAHGVNCQGVMASGIAGQIRAMYPEVYHKYMEKFKYFDSKKTRYDMLGSIQAVPVDNDRLIFNVATQFTYGRDPNKRYVNYAAVMTGLSGVVDFVSDHAWDFPDDNEWITLGIPWIGCGLANGEKSIIREILELIENNQKYLPKVEFHVYEFNG